MNGGKRANRAGKVLEKTLEGVLLGNRVNFVPQFVLGEPGIYGQRIKVDFYVPEPRMIIEAKWQDVGGTADEKLPFLLLNIERSYPCETVIVCDGEGWREGALSWASAQVTEQSRLRNVFTIAQFVSWCGRTLGQ